MKCKLTVFLLVSLLSVSALGGQGIIVGEPNKDSGFNSEVCRNLQAPVLMVPMDEESAQRIPVAQATGQVKTKVKTSSALLKEAKKLVSADALTGYSQEVQNIVRACDGDVYKIYDLIHNEVKFQSYFGFRKSSEQTWRSRCGNDADQALLLYECLSAAGYPMYFQFGLVYVPINDALEWFDCDDINALDAVTASSGYFAVPASAVEGGPVVFLGIEQIWCVVQVDGIWHRLSPGYNKYETVEGEDISAIMEYDSSELMSLAGGAEGDGFVQGVDESAVFDYLKTCSTNILERVQGDYSGADMLDLLGGRKVVKDELGEGFQNGFYEGEGLLANNYVSFYFQQPYADQYFEGVKYTFYTHLTIAVGEVNSAGDTFVAPPSAYIQGVTAAFSGKKVTISFNEENRAVLSLDDVAIDIESGTPSDASIGAAFLIEYPYSRSAGTMYNKQVVRPIHRDGVYVYVYDGGGVGNETNLRQRRQYLEKLKQDGFTSETPELIGEYLYTLGLEWDIEHDLLLGILEQQHRFAPILQHRMHLLRQEKFFGMDALMTMPQPSKAGIVLRAGYSNASTMLGSALEHGVLEQRGELSVSTIRFLRENNLSGGKTFWATDENYDIEVASDPDFQVGWGAYYLEDLFPDLLDSGKTLVLPESGSISVGELTGNGFISFDDSSLAAFIYPGKLNGGFSVTSGTVTEIPVDDFPDPTPGPDNIPNPESKEPIDLFSGAYVYDGIDLGVSGSGLHGLGFQRSYSSLASQSNQGMGYGWSHGYQSSIVEYSDVESALGRDPSHAASMIAAIWAAADMYDNMESPKAWLIGSLACYWSMDQMKNNTLSVNTGRHCIPFTRMADGSYLPPVGINADLSHDEESGEYTLTEPYGRVSLFNDQGHLQSVSDADGNQLAFTYSDGDDGEQILSSVTDACGRSLDFSYTKGMLTRVADSTGRAVTYGYDGNLLTSVTDPEGHKTQYEYDDQNRISKLINKNGDTLAENTYDDLGNMIFQVAEGDAEQTWEYAFTGVLNTETMPSGDQSALFYDEFGRVVSSVDGAGAATDYTYNGQNQLVRITNALGGVTRFEYDERNNLRFVYDARNGESGVTYKTERQYDDQDHLTAIIDELGNETHFTYDDTHQLTSIVDSLGRETSMEYNDRGLVSSIHAPGGSVGEILTTTIAYDANAYPVEITRPDGSVVRQSFNDYGDVLTRELVSAGDENTYPATFTYDLNRRLVSVTDALGYGSLHEYDNVGNLVRSINRFGQETTASWSPLSHMETLTGADGNTTEINYDASARIPSMTNALGQESELTYDEAGRVSSATNPMGESSLLEYDAVGNTVGMTNPREKTYQFDYSENGLLETMTTPLGREYGYAYDERQMLSQATMPSGETKTYTYRADGSIESVTDSMGTIKYDYDARGRVTAVSEGIESTSRSYDVLDRVVSFTDENGKTIGYGYNGAGLMTKLAYPDGKGDVAYAYDNAGRLISITDWAGRITEFVYDDHSRLSEVNYPNGMRRTYLYDDAGRMLAQTDTNTSSSEIVLNQEYAYDDLGRVNEETVTPYPNSYTIDPILMSYDDDDRIISWDNGELVISPEFDLDGNMTSGPLNGVEASFVYDARNRLIQAGTSTYSYGVEGRRMSKAEGGVTTTYVHDPYAGLSRLLEKTTDGVTTFYVYVGSQLLYEECEGKIRVYHSDSRGSTLAMTDESGSVSCRVSYGTYGEVISMSGDVDTPMLFCGAYGVLTDANGLVFMRARYYSSELRRFLNADPIGFGGGMNWFAYAGGNPIGLVDPLGWASEKPSEEKSWGRKIIEWLERRVRNQKVSPWQPGMSMNGNGYSIPPLPCPSPPPEIIQGPINSTGHGRLVLDSASYYAVAGGGAGNTVLYLDNGTTAVYTTLQAGVGFGWEGSSVMYGEVDGVYYPSDFEGVTLNVSASNWVGVDISYSPQAVFTGDGTFSYAAGVSPQAGASGNIQVTKLNAVIVPDP